MTHFIAVREQIHSNLLGLHVQRGGWVTDNTILQLTGAVYGKSDGLQASLGRAIGIVGGRLRLQAYSLTFIDGFYLVAWVCVAALVLTSLIRRSPLNYAEIAFGTRAAKLPVGGKKP